MTDYTKLTEREINEAVLEARGWGNVWKKGSLVEEDAEETCALVGFRECPVRINICSNPKNWAPLLEELRELGLIKINADDVFFRKYNESATIAVEADTLGKAICILWLIVKEVSNEKL